MRGSTRHGQVGSRPSLTLTHARCTVPLSRSRGATPALPLPPLGRATTALTTFEAAAHAATESIRRLADQLHPELIAQQTIEHVRAERGELGVANLELLIRARSLIESELTVEMFWESAIEILDQ